MPVTISAPPMRHFVFGYGSLIWRPGFEFVAAQNGLLRGAHRSLCIYSHHYRGTVERPGLVFGLVRGGSCRGRVFEVAPEAWEAVVAYLRERELVTDVYKEAMRPVALDSGQSVSALTYVVDEAHIQYAGRLAVLEQMAMVREAAGIAGPNIDYVLNTVDHLKALGIRDRQLEALTEQLRQLS